MEIKKEIKSDLKSNNISLRLNSYGDIFSSFDARSSFSQKALSDDFLLECRGASEDKLDKFELVLFVPKQERNLESEFQIKKRLKDHFYKHFLGKEKEIKKIKKEGWIWVAIGSVLMMFLAIIVFLGDGIGNLIVALSVLLEAPAWFSFWEGLYKIFITSKEYLPEFEFYRKMSECQIVFRSS